LVDGQVARDLEKKVMILTALVAIAGSSSIHFQPTMEVQTVPISNATVSVTITNRGESLVQFWVTQYPLNHRLELWRLDGEPVPKTAAGQAAHDSFGSLVRDKNYPVLLAPGKSYRSVSPPLGSWFKLAPGTYRARVTYRDMNFKKRLELQTDEFRVVVRPGGN
jgi:hypothetical protein